MKKITISENKKNNIIIKLFDISFDEVTYYFGVIVARLCYQFHPEDNDLPFIFCMNIFNNAQTEFLRLKGGNKK